MGTSIKFEKILNTLHKLPSAPQGVRPNVHKTTKREPVLPPIFDSYRTCVIAPDHLFIASGQDVLNSVITPLPAGVRKWQNNR